MKPNQRVAVEVTEYGEPMRFPSRVEDVTPECVVLAGPSEKGQPIRLADGARIRVVLFVDGGVHAFESVVVDSELFPVPLVKVRRPTRISALQRRMFFREPAVVRTLCRREADGADLCLEGYTRNLSGGGVAVRTTSLDESLRMLAVAEPDEPLWVEVQLPDHPMRALAVLTWWSVNDAEGHADLAFEFLDLAESERERLIKYLFTLQRNALRRGI